MVPDISALVLAGLFLFLALAALTLMASLRRPRDPLLAAFALSVGLFGARLAVRTQLSRDLLGAESCEFAADIITYLIPLPILLATAAVIAGGWRTPARALVVAPATRLPEVAGLSLAARYVPFSAVAGDFYDVIAEDGNGVAIIVADVTGHGVPAALVASMMKVACALAAEELADPSRGLAR